MTIRTLVFTVVACASAASMTAFAHPGGHDDDEKLIPTTCAQLADKERYTDDISYPEVNALKERCDAEKKVQVEPRKTTAPRSSDKDS
jgi:hypothetical protein